MSALFLFFPWLKPYGFAIRLLGILASVIALASAGAILMHDRDEARYQKEKADALAAAKRAQDQAVAAAISVLQADRQREILAAEDLHRQQLQAANVRLAAAGDVASHAESYSCRLGEAGFQIEMEAFK